MFSGALTTSEVTVQAKILYIGGSGASFIHHSNHEFEEGGMNHKCESMSPWYLVAILRRITCAPVYIFCLVFWALSLASELWVVSHGELPPAPAPGATQLWSNSRTGHSWRRSSGQTSAQFRDNSLMWAVHINSFSDSIVITSCHYNRIVEGGVSWVWSVFLFLGQNILCVQSKPRCGHPVIILTSLFKPVTVFWCFIFFWKYKWNNRAISSRQVSKHEKLKIRVG